MSKNNTVTVVICEGDRGRREKYEHYVRTVVKEDDGQHIKREPEIVHFNDGYRVLEFMKRRGHTKGVILLTGGMTFYMDGGWLCRRLYETGLLPKHIAFHGASERCRLLDNSKTAPELCGRISFFEQVSSRGPGGVAAYNEGFLRIRRFLEERLPQAQTDYYDELKAAPSYVPGAHELSDFDRTTLEMFHGLAPRKTLYPRLN